MRVLLVSVYSLELVTLVVGVVGAVVEVVGAEGRQRNLQKMNNSSKHNQMIHQKLLLKL